MDQSGVMYDQAYQLRQLVSRIRPTIGQEPRSVISVRIYGVRQGVGSSTIVSALAEHWHRTGWIVYLANGCPVAEITGFVDVLLRFDDRRNFEGATAKNSGREFQATQLATAVMNGNRIADATSRKILLLKDCGVVDEREELTLEGVGGLVLVTTPAPTDIMKAYAVTKRTVRRISSGTLTIVINKCPDLSIGQEMARRLQNACEKFLGSNRVNQFVLPVFRETKAQSGSQRADDKCGSLPQPSGPVPIDCLQPEDNGNDPAWKTIRSIARAIVEGATRNSGTSGQEGDQ
jgi:hypothetical protein